MNSENESNVNNEKPIENTVKKDNKFTLFFINILKWVIALYLLGFLLDINSFFLSQISPQLAQSFINSEFVVKEFVDFIDFVRSPLITLVLLAIYFVPMMLLTSIIIWSIHKFFSRNEIKVYFAITFIFMFTLSLSAFLFG